VHEAVFAFARPNQRKILETTQIVTKTIRPLKRETSETAVINVYVLFAPFLVKLPWIREYDFRILFFVHRKL
jgi:hypothetical protein